MSTPRKPRLLDLFCGAGGASVGYGLAGFEVVGVDINPQPNYPFEFHQLDALELMAPGVLHNWNWYGRGFDAIHASPPCQRFSSMQKRWHREDDHPDFIGPIRERLEATRLPYVIENVVGSPLLDPVQLCGSMFNLGVYLGEEYLQLRRHRLFETNFPLIVPKCNHRGRAVGVYGHPGGRSTRDGIQFAQAKDWKEAMECAWMTTKELTESIPPAYTEWIGRQLLLEV